MRSVRKELRLRPGLVERVEAARGGLSFNGFVERALEGALRGEDERAGTRPHESPARTPLDQAPPPTPVGPAPAKPSSPKPVSRSARLGPITVPAEGPDRADFFRRLSEGR